MNGEEAGKISYPFLLLVNNSIGLDSPISARTEQKGTQDRGLGAKIASQPPSAAAGPTCTANTVGPDRSSVNIGPVPTQHPPFPLSRNNIHTDVQKGMFSSTFASSHKDKFQIRLTITSGHIGTYDSPKELRIILLDSWNHFLASCGGTFSSSHVFYSLVADWNRGNTWESKIKLTLTLVTLRGI